MNQKEEKVRELTQKLDDLLIRQDNFSKEIITLKAEIEIIKEFISSEKDTTPLVTLEAIKPVEEEIPVVKENIINPEKVKTIVPEVKQPETIRDIYQSYKEKKSVQTFEPKPLIAKGKSDLEKFIGENLINKIGIAITVLGVGVGAKYSIEHNLISPLTRILLGYLMAIGLLGFGIKLKKNYESFSAVLVSGSIAILYFISFAAYSFYGLIPQAICFVLMVIFTGFGVLAAIHYNRQVIALIGLVGAYAVPFLLSDGSGKVVILFSYMSIINIGILVIAIKKYWKLLYYAAYFLSWIIFISWYADRYDSAQHFGIGMFFLFIFFLTFYGIFLVYKLSGREKFVRPDVLMLMSNSFVFYATGYAMMSLHPVGKNYLGLFTLGNAVIHFFVSAVIYRRKLADRNLFLLVVGMVLVFITITIPVQLNGHWITLLWAGEATILFWVGRTKAVSFYEKFAYPLIFLTFFSLIQDWAAHYNQYVHGDAANRMMSIFNIQFLSSLLVAFALGFIIYLSNHNKFSKPAFKSEFVQLFLYYSIPAIFLIVLYNLFMLEIANYFHQQYEDSYLLMKIKGDVVPVVYQNESLQQFGQIWIVLYTLFFFGVLSKVNMLKYRNRALGNINLFSNLFVLFLAIGTGLYLLSELRDTYIQQSLANYYYRGIGYILIRYLFIGLLSLFLWINYKFVRCEWMCLPQPDTYIAFELLVSLVIVWVSSSELITRMSIDHFPQSYKLGLSILWGIESLVLIVVGIGMGKKHLRIGAISLFSVTLVKLFFYDIASLDTIAKTIVFVSLGILLLIISFLYNKFKSRISKENEQ